MKAFPVCHNASHYRSTLARRWTMSFFKSWFGKVEADPVVEPFPKGAFPRVHSFRLREPVRDASSMPSFICVYNSLLHQLTSFYCDMITTPPITELQEVGVQIDELKQKFTAHLNAITALAYVRIV